MRDEGGIDVRMNETISDDPFVEIGPLLPAERSTAVGILAEGLRGSPLHVAAFGHESPAPLPLVKRFYDWGIPWTEWQTLVARGGDGTIVGVMSVAAPGACGLLAGNVGALSRVFKSHPHVARQAKEWLGAWRDRDPLGRHWHLGALAIDPLLRGREIRSQLLRVFSAQMDAGKESAYLETDDLESVSLYERFGFDVMGERSLLGARNWFMIRRPHGGSGEAEGGIST